MDRRLLICALAGWPAAHLLAQPQEPRPRLKVSAAELHQALSARFPVRFGVPGLVELEVSAPQLLLLPARNQLGAALLVQASGPALRRMQAGEMDVMFSLRYEPADQTLRAHHMEILDIRMPGLSADGLQVLRTVLPEVAREVVGEVVLHKFTQRQLALADTMGFEPEKVTVVEDGLVVVFAPKPPR
jgi:hypothetical protein